MILSVVCLPIRLRGQNWYSPTETTVVLKIFETEKIEHPHESAPGTLQTDGRTYIRIAGTDGWIGVRALQLPGKKRLKTDELLRGFKPTGECRVH